jgi:NADH-quinone oxidoreductase subunit H
MFSICIILIGIFSRNKYSVISAIRACCLVLNLEILLGFIFLFILAYSESFSFSSIINLQAYNFYFINSVIPILPIIIITFLLETNRAPFDLVEAESELIAGYTTELGGFFFALFYLGEYFHLFFFSLIVSCLFLGG